MCSERGEVGGVTRRYIPSVESTTPGYDGEEKAPLFLMRTWSGSYVEPRRWHLATLGWARTAWHWLAVKFGGRGIQNPWDGGPP